MGTARTKFSGNGIIATYEETSPLTDKPLSEGSRGAEVLDYDNRNLLRIHRGGASFQRSARNAPEGLPDLQVRLREVLRITEIKILSIGR